MSVFKPNNVKPRDRVNGDRDNGRKSDRIKSKSNQKISNKSIDQETRNIINLARLESYEMDIYEESTGKLSKDDDTYRDNENNNNGTVSQPGRRRSSNREAKEKAISAISRGEGNKNIDQIIAEEKYENEPHPNYLTIIPPPSRFAPRHFCSVCGFLGPLTCTRCGLRFCSKKCNLLHRETRCLKFTA